MEVKNSTITITCCSSDEPDAMPQEDSSVYCCCIPIRKTSKDNLCDKAGTIDEQQGESSRPAECPTATHQMTQN